MTSNTVKRITPPMDKRGKQAVQVSLNCFDFTKLGINAIKQANINGLEIAIPNFYFEYVEDIEIQELMPNPELSLDVITVVIARGSGFINTVDLACIFGAVRIPATFLTPITISCLVPNGSPG